MQASAPTFVAYLQPAIGSAALQPLYVVARLGV